MAEAHEQRANRGQVSGFQRERLEELVDLFGSFGGSIVSDGFAGQPPPDNSNRIMGDFQYSSPSGLESEFSSRFREGRIEAADRRLSACFRDPNDEGAK
jgi:hypothetical protein